MTMCGMQQGRDALNNNHDVYGDYREQLNPLPSHVGTKSSISFLDFIVCGFFFAWTHQRYRLPVLYFVIRHQKAVPLSLAIHFMHLRIHSTRARVSCYSLHTALPPML